MPSPTPAPVGAIRDLICSYPWPCSEALAVAWCESNHRPNAVSPDGANIGLFQVNVIHKGRVNATTTELAAILLLDPETNVRVAYAIWADQGWGPWSCKP
jgi:hypothetical protein